MGKLIDVYGAGYAEVLAVANNKSVDFRYMGRDCRALRGGLL